ncbi:MAG: tRNA lysidine(34) synthetase TilS [Bacteroidales bacterium]|nr:tRNA lysidine(34) synthetase TilS [Bacteroidales bacterium]
MIDNFCSFLKDSLQISHLDKILITVSGGADSVAMLDLFSRSDFKCAVAHCNFHLRGSESDGDEKFVKKLSAHHHLPFYKIDFKTREYAENNGISVEMAARELRYNWFEQIRQSNDYQYIATAHHQDDVIETFFINLSRGTGIRGLSGIKAKSGNIIRPMLFADRAQIMEYLKENNLSFREDSTNSDINIIRNRFRHQILPLLKEINPAAKKNVLQTIENLKDSEIIINKTIKTLKEKISIFEGNTTKILLDELIKIDPLKPFLYELLAPYGFNASQITDITEALNTAPGKIFNSNTHQLIRDRDALLIHPINSKVNISIMLKTEDEFIQLPTNEKIYLKRIKKDHTFKIPLQLNVAALDMDKLKFPLEIRNWKSGDYFYPLGMNKRKKLSDFFIDEKYSIIDKQHILLLLSDNQIVWLLNKRIDNRFKITPETKNILLLEIK